MYSISVSANIEASHFLNLSSDSEDQRRAIHGHSYKCTATFEDIELDRRGVLYDLDMLSQALNSVCALLDHKLLNDVEGLEFATMESMCKFIYERLSAEFSNVKSIELYRPTLDFRASYRPSA